MASSAKDSVFTTAPTRDKTDETTRAVRTIIDAEGTAREDKTAKLRELRLQRAAAEGVPTSARPAKKKHGIAKH
jgi:hypothetical protein